MTIRIAYICIGLLFFGTITQVSGQFLRSSVRELNFGTKTELQNDSLPLVLTNPSTDPIQVRKIKFYAIYGSNDFSTKDTNFTIAPNGTKTIYVKFKPRHNIFYQSQMVFLDNGKRGSWSVELKGQGQYSNVYYASTTNLKEENLKLSLNTLLGVGYISLGYNKARDTMMLAIDNLKVNGQGASVNTLIDAYCVQTVTGFASRTDVQNTPYGSCTSVCYNTEHTWPQGLFSQNEPMRSDIFHLYTVLEDANSIRSNYPFGNVSNPSWALNGSKFGSGIFEPRDDHKGRVARSMFYFCIRYQNYSNFLDGQETVLRDWFLRFPPDAKEKRRNEDIRKYQKNRNPFIDYPQFLERISKISSTSIENFNYKTDTSVTNIDFGVLIDTLGRYFQYPIVNASNGLLTITGIQLKSGSNFNLKTAYGQTVLSQGQKVNLEIGWNILASNGLVQDTLLFSSIGSNRTNYKIPISGNIQRTSTDVNPTETEPEQWVVYPNPVEKQVYVVSNKAVNVDIELVDISGKPVGLEMNSQGTESVISTASLESGIYFLIVKSANTKTIKKLIKL